MLLAVAGLDAEQIEAHTRRLAAGDWSAFPPSDHAAFDYARKISLDPASVTGDDVRELECQFGRARALDVIWWLSRCHYMTRVADAFQLPLEKVNVFANSGYRK